MEKVPRGYLLSIAGKLGRAFLVGCTWNVELFSFPLPVLPSSTHSQFAAHSSEGYCKGNVLDGITRYNLQQM